MCFQKTSGTSRTCSSLRQCCRAPEAQTAAERGVQGSGSVVRAPRGFARPRRACPVQSPSEGAVALRAQRQTMGAGFVSQGHGLFLRGRARALRGVAIVFGAKCLLFVPRKGLPD
ncbi:hypothetical protein MRX96_019583 [Rhipicephalus microplus]